MAEIPPWLVPPNFIGAMEGGARLGLAGRSQDFQEQSAADRLKLAYDQLAKQERIASMQAQQRLKLGEAANALRMAHESALQSHYQTMQERAAQVAQAAADRLKQPKIIHGVNGEVISVDPITQEVRTLKPATEKPLSPGTVEYDATGAIKGVRGAPGSASVKFLENKMARDKAAAEALAAQPGWFSKTFLGKKPTQGKFKVIAVDGKPVGASESSTEDDTEE